MMLIPRVVDLLEGVFIIATLFTKAFFATCLWKKTWMGFSKSKMRQKSEKKRIMGSALAQKEIKNALRIFKKRAWNITEEYFWHVI